MRNVNRLDESYAKIAEIHKRYFPDMREGQFLLNFMGQMKRKHGDPFFWESDRFVDYAEEYARNSSPYFQGGDLLGGENNV